MAALVVLGLIAVVVSIVGLGLTLGVHRRLDREKGEKK